MTTSAISRGSAAARPAWFAACALALAAGAALAHPQGNATVNRQAAIVVHADRAELRYLLDLAEIPTLIAAGEADADGDGATGAAEWEGWVAQTASAVAAGLHLAAGAGDLALRSQVTSWRLDPGDAGLEVLRLELQLVGALPPGAATLDYRDDYEPNRIGWKEVVATAGEGVRIVYSDVPSKARSLDLRRFDGDPPAVLSARIGYEARAVVAPQSQAPRPLPAPAPARAAVPAAEGEPAGAFAQAAYEPAAAPRALARSPMVPVGDRTARAAEFFRLGAHHIAQGPDHLAFLLGLLLLGTRLWQAAQSITAFTLAHSLTLAAVACGVVVAPGMLVEAAIAASIVYVGWAGWRARGPRHGVWLAFAFGLVHGLGFAAGLVELLGGGPVDLLVELASFNLGIEAMQLGLVALGLPLLHAARRYPWGLAARRALSAAVGCAGCVWLLTRTAAALA